MSNQAAPGPHLDDGRPVRPRLTLRRRLERDVEGDGLAHRLAQQWSRRRPDRAAEQPVQPVRTGPSNFTRAQVPWGVDLTAAWAWRFLVIVAAGYLIAKAVGFLAFVTIPVVAALLIAALAAPLVDLLDRIGLPRGLATALTMIGGIALLAAMLTFVGQQIADGASDLAASSAEGLGQIRDWLRTGPLNVSNAQINNYLDDAQRALGDQAQGREVFSRVGELGTTLSHLLAAFFIVLFSIYFFLADGARIWAWVVRLAPRAARERVDSSGRVAWISLTQFVRATVVVALTDALGVMIVAAVLGVPFVFAIGVLVFIGAFVPIIGATVAGSVAILVALVDEGPVTALLMLAGVVAVQQFEGHVLQPFLMGRWVSLHPLGVIIAVGVGVLVAGIPGVLVAVPFAAAANAVVQHLASHTEPGEDPERELAEDYEKTGDDPTESIATGGDEGAVGDVDVAKPEERRE